MVPYQRELHVFVGEKLLPAGGVKRGHDRIAGVLRFLVAAAAAEAAEEGDKEDCPLQVESSVSVYNHVNVSVYPHERFCIHRHRCTQGFG